MVRPVEDRDARLIYSGNRDRFAANSTAFGERPVDSYTTVDWLSGVDAPRGMIRLGIQNLLNRQYFLRDSQLLRTRGNLSLAAAQGAVVSLAYTVSY